MRFTKDQLIAAARKKIVYIEAKSEAEHNKKVSTYESQRAAWRAKYSNTYRELARDILDAVSNGDVVTKEMLNRVQDKNGYALLTFDASSPVKSDPDTARYTTLIAVLEANTEDSITRAELKELGFNPTDLF